MSHPTVLEEDQELGFLTSILLRHTQSTNTFAATWARLRAISMVLSEHRVDVSSAKRNGVVPGRALSLDVRDASHSQNRVGDRTRPWERSTLHTHSPLLVPFSSMQALLSHRKFQTQVQTCSMPWGVLSLDFNSGKT